jgi:hypothetical protein
MSLALAPSVRSVGPCPERAADRLVGAMMRAISEHRAGIVPLINDVFISGKDGSPVAQRKLAERIMRAGALGFHLKPGKRGKFDLQIHDLVGYDSVRQAEIKIGDRIPERPQLAWVVTSIKGMGRGKYTQDSVPLMIVSHHALSRLVQRCDARSARI